MDILVDVGGSGVKIADHTKGVIGKIERYPDVKTYKAFVEAIHKRSGGKHVSALAISTAGYVDTLNGRVLKSRCASYLEGDLVLRLKKEFPLCSISVVNDGEAHARALLIKERKVEFGAIHFALGTSISMGVINNRREIVRPCTGNNWDIGEYELKTEEKPSSAWLCLGSEGLRKLEEKAKDDPYIHFGWRLGSFLRNMIFIFQPSTIGLSGGIITAHGSKILSGVREELKLAEGTDWVRILMLDSPMTVMEGLTTLV